MTDNLNAEQRRHAMRRVKSRDTSPELLVRKLLASIGKTGYRLHRNDIIGNPDIAWVGKRKVIFINGCFWHGHNCPRGSRTPKTRIEYWTAKIDRTRQRDISHVKNLESLGWSVLTLWECQLRNEDLLRNILLKFLK